MKKHYVCGMLLCCLALFSASSLARESACDSDGEDQDYDEVSKTLKIKRLCRFSSEYLAAFRFVWLPSDHKPVSFTLYQSHQGEVSLHENGALKRIIELAEYGELLGLVKPLDFFEIESYEALLEHCEIKDWERCPVGRDGASWYLELSYGGNKRTVQRYGGDETTESAFTALVEKLYQLGRPNNMPPLY